MGAHGVAYLIRAGLLWERATSNKRKGILKLSRKQKVRKQARKDRAEAVVDRVSAKGVRDAKKLNRKLAAKALW